MLTNHCPLFPALTLFAALAGGCALAGTSDDLAADPDGGEEAGGEASDAITSSELSVLFTGKSLPVTNPYKPNGVHAGVDFGSTGDGITAVRSPVNGTITANTSACGKVAIFDGTNTLIFAHMTARTALAVGSTVAIGTYLGKASQVVGGGCTATGAHLHIEIRTGNNNSMASPTANNSATTLDPLAYPYGPFAAVPLVSPAAGAAVAGNPVTFSWSPIQGATSYRLQVASASGFSGDSCVGTCVSNDTTGGTQFQATLPAPGTYYWRVRAGSSYSGGIWSPVRKVLK